MHRVTFDVEEWYCANYASAPGGPASAAEGPTRLLENVRTLLDVCERHGLRSTCFVLGSVAEEKPEVAREIHARGHEVASHGHRHRKVSDMTPEEFERDLALSLRALEAATGARVRGYRAASWSVDAEVVPWFYAALERHGIEYSSSVYPARTYLYGIPGFPRAPHHPVASGAGSRVREYPVPVTKLLGVPVGFSGGFYFRLFPLWLIRRELARERRAGRSPFVYLHPREVDPFGPRLELGRRDAFVHYHGLASARAKLDACCAFLSRLPA